MGHGVVIEACESIAYQGKDILPLYLRDCLYQSLYQTLMVAFILSNTNAFET